MAQEKRINSRRFTQISAVSFCLVCTLFISILPASKETVPVTGNSSTMQGANQAKKQAFAPITANVRVLYPDNQPMSEASVVAINQEYCFRYTAWTNASGWVIFRIVPGEWSFFAYPGWAKATAFQGKGYLPFELRHNFTSSETISLRPDTTVEMRLNSSINELQDLDWTELRIIESTTAWLGSCETTGISKFNNLTLYTNQNLRARISLAKSASQSQPGLVFLSDSVDLREAIQLNISNLNTATLRFVFKDVHNNLASGHIQFQILERTWSWSPNIYDCRLGDPAFIVSPHNFYIVPAVELWLDSSRYSLSFNHKHIKPVVGTEMMLTFGGPLSSRVLITPRAANGFKPATQVMLHTTDDSGNIVLEAWGPADRMEPHLLITADGGRKSEIDMELAFSSKISEEFDGSEHPSYKITYDFGPFGNGTFEGGLYDSDALKMIIYETDRLIPQSSSIDNALRTTQVDSYEALFRSMEELLGVPTDYKIGVISNIMSAGFEDEILHGFKLELPLEIMFPPTWPLGDFFIAHEMGHGRIHKAPANFVLFRTYGEAYATLMGYKARARLFGDERLFDFLMGQHDLFLRHQHGDSVQSDFDFIEIVAFITYYIDKNFGWDAHRRMILEWENAFRPIRNILSFEGFTDIEQMAIIYSHIVGENLAWLFELGSFDVWEARVDAGLALIDQDQEATGNVELKIGESTAITYTVSVPIMLTRTPLSISKINLTLSFDSNLGRVSYVYKRDLTDNEDWNLITTSEGNGQLTITLKGSKAIKGPGSVAQVNFELFPSTIGELPIEASDVSAEPGNTVAAGVGRILMSQLSVVRPKNLPFRVVRNQEIYYVQISSNSSINNFDFNSSNEIMSFNVTAPMGTIGFSNVTIHNNLLSRPYSVLVDDLLPLTLNETSNSTHTSLFFTYNHTKRLVRIFHTLTTISLNGVLGDNDWFRADVTVTLSTIDDTRVDKTEYSFDNANWITYTAPFIIIQEGYTMIYYKSTDKAGNIEPTKMKTVKIDKTQPIANAGADKTVNEDTPVTFDGSASTDEYGIATYTWTFTDTTPQTLTGKNPTCTFATPGTYTITLRVTDSAGNSAADTVKITVLDITKPTVNAGSNQTVNEDTLVTFDARASSDNVGIMSYAWTFTDAGTEQTLDGLNPTYTFQTPGTYTVTLKVADAADNSATDTVTITVLDVTKPVANAGSDRTVNEDTQITLDGSASSDNLGITTCTWTFTDVILKTLTVEKPTYTFNTPGAYTITLNVTDGAGNWATDTITITVLDITKPVANAGNDQTVNVGTTITFDSSASSDNMGIVSCQWEFGDGTTGTGKTTTHTYNTPKTYTVTLTVKDSAGNSASDSLTITVRSEGAPPPLGEIFPIWIVGGAIIAIGIAVAAALLWKKRK